MELNELIGFAGIVFGFLVPLPQIQKILKTRDVSSISLGTYTFLLLAIVCYFIHAVAIQDLVFTVSNGINLVTNSCIWVWILVDRWKLQKTRSK
ncbi:MAG: SemiSWEET family sugar transporter [bacterium]